MPRQELDGSIRDWVDEETRHIDVVASWESMCDTYETLKFSDPLTDAERLEEFRWIVQQMNSFLSKIRTRMLSCKDYEAMVEMLRKTYIPAGKVELSTRKALVYQKLRQQWIGMEVMKLQTMMMEETDGPQESEDGW